jgi:predicted CXXCH cytochrome family protein
MCKASLPGYVAMKKTILTLVTALFFTVFFYVPSNAATCVDCHSRFEIQVSEELLRNGYYLLLQSADCVACHTGTFTAKTTPLGAPQVWTESEPHEMLSGGNFYWVGTAGDDKKGHNVAGVSSQDTRMRSYTPPGWTPRATNSFAPPGYNAGEVNDGMTLWWIQLTCAGTNGCHGHHSYINPMEAMKGTHHNNTGGDWGNNKYGVADGSSLPNSYRFLQDIWGGEDGDAEWTISSSDHNEYSGENNTSNERDNDLIDHYGTGTTISFLCAKCHGIFHARIDSNVYFGSPFVRHPTDIVMPERGEYRFYNPKDNGKYNPLVPVARGSAPKKSSSMVIPGSTSATGAIVMCLSCHRAHGSNYPDILRFNYSAIDTDNGNNDVGCFVCHASKNGD